MAPQVDGRVHRLPFLWPNVLGHYEGVRCHANGDLELLDVSNWTSVAFAGMCPSRLRCLTFRLPFALALKGRHLDATEQHVLTSESPQVLARECRRFAGFGALKYVAATMSG